MSGHEHICIVISFLINDPYFTTLTGGKIWVIYYKPTDHICVMYRYHYEKGFNGIISMHSSCQ